MIGDCRGHALDDVPTLFELDAIWLVFFINWNIQDGCFVVSIVIGAVEYRPIQFMTRRTVDKVGGAFVVEDEIVIVGEIEVWSGRMCHIEFISLAARNGLFCGGMIKEEAVRMGALADCDTFEAPASKFVACVNTLFGEFDIC